MNDKVFKLIYNGLQVGHKNNAKLKQDPTPWSLRIQSCEGFL